MIRMKRGRYYVYKKGKLDEFDTREEAEYFDKNGKTMQKETTSFLVPDDLIPDGSED